MLKEFRREEMTQTHQSGSGIPATGTEPKRSYPRRTTRIGIWER